MAAGNKACRMVSRKLLSDIWRIRSGGRISLMASTYEKMYGNRCAYNLLKVLTTVIGVC